ncbi:MAG: Efflux ABC transporter, ATP-binding protein, partial [uncultured Solirubrobacteraceae bacterium]
ARSRPLRAAARQDVRGRVHRAAGAGPRGPGRRVLRPARPERGGKDDAHLVGLQPPDPDVRAHRGLRARARHDGRAAARGPGRAGREPRPLPRRGGGPALPRRLLGHEPGAGAPARGRDDGDLRPHRQGAGPPAEALGRHAPPAPARPRAHARAAPRLPRRADGRRGLRAAHGAVGVHPPPARAGHHDPPHDALPRGGRGAVRGGGAHPRRLHHRPRLGGRAARGLRRRVAGRRVRQGDGAGGM